MALPKVVTHQDRLLSVNIHESQEFPGSESGSTIIPLFLDRENGVWVLYGKFDPGTTLPPHFHTGTVHFFTTKGQWNYVEYPDDPQTAGSYLYEPGGSVHTFSVPADATEPAEGFMVVYGANVIFADGEYQSVRDAGAIEEGILAAARKAGLPVPRYIRPKGGAEFSRD
ncbi:2,4'-dihydroxyacetophenone dioxygenase family protein [Cupriavidus basilensis]|uniref:2,4'-dihydroxyacetophenone dioxygenase family protein n=1 Tax=Cupriavidus basilensis TaxID=68895 RepID=UPI0020A6B25A|nr:2,4'-dihydroxyacetophenone dioxygenase family protein [Cupriavidus basilensis]MCP3018224.1 2,4'-dihydroxyacetophenone dioxygenase family protein [Cupriavidus basilensis]